MPMDKDGSHPLAALMLGKIKPKSDDGEDGTDEAPMEPHPDEVDAAHDIGAALGLPHVNAKELAMALKNWESVSGTEPDEDDEADGAEEPEPDGSEGAPPEMGE